MQRRSVTLLALSLVSAVSTITAIGHAAIARTGDAEVSFTATGPAGLKIVGTTSALQVAEVNQDVIVTVPLKSLDTKIELRNKHMREKYLEVDKYPNAELRVPRSALAVPNGAAISSKAEGTMTIHGRTQKTSFSYIAKPEGADISVSGTVHVNMTDYGIAQPGYSGISVKPDVDVHVAFRVQDR